MAGGRVYVPFGGLYGDCGNYVGYVTATPVTGNGATTRYEVPTRREGGIWARVRGRRRRGRRRVGRGRERRELPRSLRRQRFGAAAVRRSRPSTRLFAPPPGVQENAEDADLGSTGPLLLGGGRALIAGKTGVVYLLDTARLGGIGGQVSQLPGCTSFGGMAWDATAGAAFLPCTEGLLRVDVAGSGLRAGWRAAAAT